MEVFIDAVSKDKKWSAVTGVRYATIAFGK
jgi:hypothetical protein